MARLSISPRGRIHYDNSDKLSLASGAILRDDQAGAAPAPTDVFIKNKTSEISNGVGPLTAAQLQGVLVQ